MLNTKTTIITTTKSHNAEYAKQILPANIAQLAQPTV